MQKASLGARFGALLIDGLLIQIILSLTILVDWYLYLILSVFAAFLYYGIFEGSTLSATPGKKLLGIIVLDEQGNRLTYEKAFLRSLCRFLSSLLLGIGFWMALFSEDNKALHDKLAGTFVAKAAPQAFPYGQPQRAEPSAQGTVKGAPHIVGIAGQFAGKAFRLPPQGIIIGRDGASCDFSFPESTQGISRNHCKVAFNPQTQMFVLYDLGSSYGTFLAGGARVAQGQPVALHSGDAFYLASRANTFQVSI